MVDIEATAQLLIPARYRNDILAAMASSVLLAHKVEASSWGVRVDDSIMLKVGPHEVLQVGNWKLPFHLVVDRELVPRALRRRSDLSFSGDMDHHGKQGAGGFYPSNPGTEACDCDFPVVAEIYKVLYDAHASVVRRAALMRRHPSTKKTHSAEFVELLASESGYPLGQPSYVISEAESAPLFAEEVSSAECLFEGAVRRITVNAYERDRRARSRCIAHYGTQCAACGLRFERFYGEAAAGIIHVHHIVSLSEIGTEYRVDPVLDLRPVCPNCHAVIHSAQPPLSVEEVAAMVREQRSG